MPSNGDTLAPHWMRTLSFGHPVEDRTAGGGNRMDEAGLDGEDGDEVQDELDEMNSPCSGESVHDKVTLPCARIMVLTPEVHSASW